jgi:transposase
MEKCNRLFVGCDLGDKRSDYCILDGEGAVVEEGQVRTTTAGFSRRFQSLQNARVVVEVGTHSRWVAELLRKMGHEVVVANARYVQLIWKRRHKTDRTDAQVLARLGRLDVSLLAPVQHRSREAQQDLACLKSRDLLVSTRTKLINHVRGAMKPFGIRFPKCSPESLPKRADTVPAELVPALRPVLETIAQLNAQIAAQDRQIEQLAGVAHPETARLRQVAGVGAITGLGFLLTIEDPSRFRKSRHVAPFLGLTPAKDQSGDHDPQKRISRAGDPFLRKLLIQCAHQILGRFGADSDLRTWGLVLASRGGKNGKKRAVVAVARKLAVLLHRLWVTGARYQPVGYRVTVATA